MQNPPKYVNLNAYSVEAMLSAVIDMGFTPLMQINTNRSIRICTLPEQLVDANGSITLNVSANAVRGFGIDKEQGYLTFDATFNRRHVTVLVPCEAIVAIFARENTKVACTFVPNIAFMTTEGIVEGEEPKEIAEEIAKKQKAPKPKAPKTAIKNDDNNVVNLFKNR
jgi:stringent starvation protein B